MLVAFNFSKTKETSKLGILLINKGFINEVELEQALTYQSQKNLKLGESLIKLGFIESKQLNKVLSRQRWARSLVAGVVMIASPMCPVLASEGGSDFQYTANSGSQAKGVDDFSVSHLDYSAQDKFVLGIKHRVSFRSGLELGLGNPSYMMNENHFNQVQQNDYIPQISIFTSKKQRTKSTSSFWNGKQVYRFDRYKNTIPAVYRLTLKGYSLFEKDDKTSEVFGFDRVKGISHKGFELMFSITKQF